ncbi:hypothetical protein ACA910_004914 [Epithemia clementina (nom. ined.)]
MEVSTSTPPPANLPPPPPSTLVKTLSNVSTTSTVTIDSAFSDSSTSPKSASSKDKGIPPKSPHSLPPLPTINGRSRSLSAESFRKKSSQRFGKRKGLKKSNSESSVVSQISMGSHKPDPQPECERLTRKLRKSVKSLGEKDPAVGEIYTTLGNLHFREGRIHEAISSYKCALECGEGTHSATACLNLGTAYWNQVNVPEAIKYLKDALTAFELGCSRSGASPDVNPEIASCHHQLGLAYALGKEYDLAVYEIESACRMRLAMYGAAHPMTARTLDAAGRIHTLRGEYDHALHCHEQALTVLQGTPHAIATLDNIASAHMGRGDALAAVHIYVEIVQSLKARWHCEITKGYYDRDPRVSQDLADYLHKLADAYRRLRHDAYADHCLDEANMVLMEGGISPYAGQDVD